MTNKDQFDLFPIEAAEAASTSLSRPILKAKTADLTISNISQKKVLSKFNLLLSIAPSTNLKQPETIRKVYFLLGMKIQ